jgi:hypothetical protein
MTSVPFVVLIASVPADVQLLSNVELPVKVRKCSVSRATGKTANRLRSASARGRGKTG